MPYRVLISALFICTAIAYAQPADLILHNGKVVTVDPQFHIVDSMAVRGDRIVAIGTRDEVHKLAGPATRRIDLNGKTVLPGLIDSHTHALSAAMYEFDHPVPEMETIADVLALRAIAGRGRSKPGEWIALAAGLHHAAPRAAISHTRRNWTRRRRATRSSSAPARTPRSTRWP